MNSHQIDFAREVGRGLTSDGLPAYAPMLAAYHRAHAAELRAIIMALPLRPGVRVLDMACGDGTYTLWLAEHVGPHGEVIGVDIAHAYLAQARQRAQNSPYAPRIHFQTGTIEHLPFENDAFDLVWCAHSLHSLPHPIEVMHELRRVVRPGGTLAVLENDALHHVVIPWPTELELAVRQAQLRALTESEGHTGKFFIARHLCTTFAAAGLSSCSVTPYTTMRHAPLTEDEQCYLTWYLRDLEMRAGPYLELAERESFAMLLNRDSPIYLLHRPDFYVMYIDVLALGVKA